METLPRDLVLRSPRQGDGPALLRLYAHAFGAHSAHPMAGAGRLARNTVVADVAGAIVGFGCWEIVREPRSDGEIAHLLACLRPPVRDVLCGPAAPGAEVDYLLAPENPPGLTPSLLHGDLCLSAVAVHPNWRRRGIGTTLVRERVRIGRARGARQAFAHALAGSGSRELYEKMGFVALITKQVHYPGGAGMTLMYGAL